MDGIEIKIPKQIADRLQKRVDESEGEFKTVGAYVEYLLEQVVEKLDTESSEDKEEEPVFSEEDEEKVKARLKSLGYLD
jgi:Arc/MetJ-type ribon-helix-helix transcriptional regulator